MIAELQAIGRYPATKKESADNILMKRIAYVEGYQQALKDVQKGVERSIMKIACPGYSSISACRDIIKYIDSLTK